MEESSVLLCKGCTPWQGLLLTASLLTSWHLSTSAHVATKTVPPQVAEGENVLFYVYSLPEDIAAFVWFKGERIVNNMKQAIAIYGLPLNISGPAPANSGRETIYRNGSLLFERVTQKDTGFYTFRTYNRHAEVVSTTSMYLHVDTFLWNCGRVSTSGQPTIEPVPPIVAEGGSVLLLIHNLPENLEVFIWFKGINVFWSHEVARYKTNEKLSMHGPAYSGREMLNSDGSLLLHNVTRKDAGLYTLRILCRDLKSEEAHVLLRVNTSLSPCCNPLTSSQLMIQPVPRYATEGESVLLQVHNLPEHLQAFTWYKEIYRAPYFEIVEEHRVLNTFTWGDHYSGKETVYANGSLLLQGVTENDAGMYMLEVLKSDSEVEKAYVQFHVNKNVAQPSVSITNSVVSSNRAVILNCVSPDTDISIRWIFNNKNLRLSRRMTLSPTKCGLRIYPVRSENYGEYRCVVSNRVSSKASLPVLLR